MIKRGILNEELNVDSRRKRKHGSCPLMPEEVFAYAAFPVLFLVRPNCLFLSVISRFTSIMEILRKIEYFFFRWAFYFVPLDIPQIQ